jgi:hypothetical protein
MNLTRPPGQPSSRWRRWAYWGQWTLFALLIFLAALCLAWQSLAQVDFLYPVWYDTIGIEQTIATYGPRNRFRHQFEHTSRVERIRLFAAIVDAIHQRGAGLADLTYHEPDGRPITRLLTPPEIVHLQDVARLIARLSAVGMLAMLGWPLLLAVLWWQRVAMPPLSHLLLTVVGLLATVGVTILVLGPVRVFYALHTWIFPPGHQWFFYYEDSLMTLLMKAPEIFGYITLTLATLTLLLFLMLLLVTAVFYRRWLVPPPPTIAR